MSDANNIALGASIILSSAKEELKEIEGLENKARKIFEMTFDDNYNWFVTEDDYRFRIGVAVLLSIVDEGETKDRIKHELKLLQCLSASMSGIPVDFGAVADEEIEPIGLLGLYREIKEQA